MLEVEETLGASNLSPELYKWKQDQEVKGYIPVAEPRISAPFVSSQALAHPLCSVKPRWCFIVRTLKASWNVCLVSAPPTTICLSVWKLCLLSSEFICSDREGKNGLVFPTFWWINKSLPVGWGHNFFKETGMQGTDYSPGLWNPNGHSVWENQTSLPFPPPSNTVLTGCQGLPRYSA